MERIKDLVIYGLLYGFITAILIGLPIVILRSDWFNSLHPLIQISYWVANIWVWGWMSVQCIAGIREKF